MTGHFLGSFAIKKPRTIRVAPANKCASLGGASSTVKKEEVGEEPVEEAPAANEAPSDLGAAAMAGSATNQEAAETTPAADSIETPGETAAGRRIKRQRRRGLERQEASSKHCWSQKEKEGLKKGEHRRRRNPWTRRSHCW